MDGTCSATGGELHTASGNMDITLFCIIRSILSFDTELWTAFNSDSSSFLCPFYPTNDNGIGILRQCFKLLMCICLTRGIVMYLRPLDFIRSPDQTVIRKPSRVIPLLSYPFSSLYDLSCMLADFTAIMESYTGIMCVKRLFQINTTSKDSFLHHTENAR